MQNQLGLSHFWQNADAVSHGVAYVLLAMSIVTWFLIAKKSLEYLNSKKIDRFLRERFWQAPDLKTSTRALADLDKNGIFSPLVIRLAQAPLGEDREAVLTRSLRQDINQSQARMESGLTALASIGSVSPFIGLFGTVWGIYHALINIAASGQVLMDKVAGPVGEALIMTAAGLAVAIPAVLAYNAFVRLNRLTQANLEGFAYDLLNYALKKV